MLEQVSPCLGSLELRSESYVSCDKKGDHRHWEQSVRSGGPQQPVTWLISARPYPCVVGRCEQSQRGNQLDIIMRVKATARRDANRRGRQEYQKRRPLSAVFRP